MPGTNTLAYFAQLSVMALQSFMKLTLGVGVIKLVLFVTNAATK
jgi:hypothetical protein